MCKGEQQYHVVQLGTCWVGLDWSLGWRASRTVHGCMVVVMCWGGLVMVGPDHLIHLPVWTGIQGLAYSYFQTEYKMTSQPAWVWRTVRKTQLNITDALQNRWMDLKIDFFPDIGRHWHPFGLWRETSSQGQRFFHFFWRNSQNGGRGR